MTDDYVAWGGRAELERRVTAPMLPPATRALFGRIGVASPARFLHVLGAGAGVAGGLGRLESDGTVVAAGHATVLVVEGVATEDGVANEVFRVTDVAASEPGLGRYDVVYARFLLSRLPCPAAATVWMARHLAAGGVLLVEDIQCESGSGLQSLLRAAGLGDVDVRVDPLPRTIQVWGRAPA